MRVRGLGRFAPVITPSDRAEQACDNCRIRPVYRVPNDQHPAFADLCKRCRDVALYRIEVRAR